MKQFATVAELRELFPEYKDSRSGNIHARLAHKVRSGEIERKLVTRDLRVFGNKVAPTQQIWAYNTKQVQQHLRSLRDRYERAAKLASS